MSRSMKMKRDSEEWENSDVEKMRRVRFEDLKDEEELGFLDLWSSKRRRREIRL